MATKTKVTRWTTAQVKEHVDKIQKLVKKSEKENRLENFLAITPAEIEKKFRRANSPMITTQGWGNSTPGGTVSYSVSVYNPDPTPVNFLFVHVWVSAAAIADPDLGTYLLNVDERFARLTEKPTTGFSLAASGGYTTLNFLLPVPANIPRSGYIGNSCLIKFNGFDTSTFLDRAAFVFKIS